MKDQNVRQPKIGLVLEGGAMRGLFTAGVLDVLMENGIMPDGAVGVSAGAVFGCNLKSGQIGRAIRYNKKYCKDPRYASFRSLIKTGDYYGAEFCYHTLPNELDPWDKEAYQKSPLVFYVTATDVLTGEAVYHRCDTGDEADIMWMRASASMPLFSKPVDIDGRLLSDGGTADSIPLRFMEEKGYLKNIVVLTQPKGFIKKANPFLPLIRVFLRKYPALIKALEHRPEHYNETLTYIEQKEKAGEIFVLRPPQALGVRAVDHDPSQLERVYQLGRATAERDLNALQNFLNRQK